MARVPGPIEDAGDRRGCDAPKVRAGDGLWKRRLCNTLVTDTAFTTHVSAGRRAARPRAVGPADESSGPYVAVAHRHASQRAIAQHCERRVECVTRS